MRDLIKRIHLIISREDLFEMANLKADETGVGFPIYVSHKGNIRHAARVKIYPDGKYDRKKRISISISDDPKVVGRSRKYNPPQKKINDAIDFVRKNHVLLQMYWDDNDMATSDLLGSIEKI